MDLGLPSGLKWARCNLGAYSPENCGDYYSWGECDPTDSYYSYGSENEGYVDIGSNISGTEYDAATSCWGGGWRMPTKEEFEELIQYCSWEWKRYRGINGYEITGRNGNRIFLPAAGDSNNPDWEYEGSYWASTLGEYDNGCVDFLTISSSLKGFHYYGDREKGYSIRPVWGKMANPGITAMERFIANPTEETLNAVEEVEKRLTEEQKVEAEQWAEEHSNEILNAVMNSQVLEKATSDVAE